MSEKKEEKKTLEDVIAEDTIPAAGVENLLNEERKKAGEAAVEEVKAIEKGEDPEKIVKKEPKKEEKVGAKPKEEEDEPIPEAERKKYGVPDTIKTRKALVEWGKNAEKKMMDTLAERERAKHAGAEFEKKIADLEARQKAFEEGLKPKIVDDGMTDEQRAIDEQNLLYLQQNKPLEYIAEIEKRLTKKALDEKSKTDKQIAETQAKEAYQKKEEGWKGELESMQKEYGDEKWKNEVLPAITKIAKERPYLQTMEEARIVYEHSKMKAEAKIKAEEEAKRAEKKGLGDEVSHKTADNVVSEEDELSKEIASIDESDPKALEKLHKKMGVKKI
jgi:hypothetical protein